MVGWLDWFLWKWMTAQLVLVHQNTSYYVYVCGGEEAVRVHVHYKSS